MKEVGNYCLFTWIQYPVCIASFNLDLSGRTGVQSFWTFASHIGRPDSKPRGQTWIMRGHFLPHRHTLHTPNKRHLRATCMLNVNNNRANSIKLLQDGNIGRSFKAAVTINGIGRILSEWYHWYLTKTSTLLIEKLPNREFTSSMIFEVVTYLRPKCLIPRYLPTYLPN
jgi:hypothetical protein